ncbi:hypothetical protein GTO89_12310 [Heliobacterium gestii]|uniref:Competence protein ComFB n=1 Tax=Heliomicrobium gestii TaxID=2699 RepID=A0A845LE36_HELGE|nr:hypothetical protein [Heliomicrobium gestii]
MYRNVMEEIVEELLNEVFETNPNVCRDCPSCRIDITAHALNRLPPKYVVHEKGRALTRIDLRDPQIRTDILSVLAQSITVINQNRWCEKAKK